MLLAAVPQSQSIKNELIATRQLTPQGILYKVLGVYQPGGLGERSSILTALGRPDTRTPTRGRPSGGSGRRRSSHARGDCEAADRSGAKGQAEVSDGRKTRPRVPYPHEEDQDEPSLRAVREGGSGHRLMVTGAQRNKEKTMKHSGRGKRRSKR